MANDATVKIRVEKEELGRWRLLAKGKLMTLSEWIRANCNLDGVNVASEIRNSTGTGLPRAVPVKRKHLPEKSGEIVTAWGCKEPVGPNVYCARCGQRH